MSRIKRLSLELLRVLVVLKSILAVGALWAGPRESTIFGRITTLEGVPLDGVEVKADSGCWKAVNPQVKTAQTDEGGNYSIEGLSPGTYCITADSPGFGPAEQRFVAALPEAATVVDLGLPLKNPTPAEETVVSGRVLVKGIPVRDATVILQSILNPTIRYQVRSDPDGRYSLKLTHFVWSMPAAGDYLLVVHKVGYESAARTFRLRFAGDNQSLEFSLKGVHGTE